MMKKTRKKFKRLSLLTGLCLTVGLSYQAYTVIHSNWMTKQMERQRLAHLDKEHLDLPLIINHTDTLGHEEYQLNWKELTALAAVQANNYGEQIQEEQLSALSSRFIENETVLSFEEVLTQFEWTEQEQERAYQYLEDLQYFGYTPEKLMPQSKEQQFISSIEESAIQNYHDYQILPSITIAQAILESNWGESELAQSANNLFGVKVGYGWTGEKATFKTREYYNTFINDEFRKYEQPGDSVKDHARFLVENPRYTKAGVFEMKTYLTQTHALEEAGYSTDQDEEGNYVYAEKLGALIRQYNLQLIDHEVKHP